MEQTEIWLAPGSVSNLTRHLDDLGKKKQVMFLPHACLPAAAFFFLLSHPHLVCAALDLAT